MISIPLNLKNEIENVIKMKFFEKIIIISNNFTNNLLYNFEISKFTKLELEYEKDCFNKLFIETIEESIPIIDNLFLNSDFRKSNFYISKRNIIRDRELYFGCLLYERNYYCDKDKKNGFFFIDELFGFEKYNKYDLLLRGLFINESINTNANQVSQNSLLNNPTILESIKFKEHPKIPRQTIYSWIKKWNIPNIEYKTIHVNSTLYVMADEKWIHKQMKKELKKKIKIGLQKYTQEQIDEFKNQLKNKHYIMSKCFIIFTGAQTKNNRTELLGRHIFVTSSKNPWRDLMDEICKIYDFQNINTINLLSDAGGWILSGKDELKLYSNNKIVVNTCEFHVKQYINRMIRDKELNELMALDIYEYEDKEDFLKFVNLVLEKRPNRHEKIIEYKNYVINHWDTIINMKYCDIKSSMESHISHYVANHFGSRPKGYSDKNIEKYLKLETMKNNGIDILDLYLSSKEQEDLKYKEKEVNFKIFDNNNTSNIPISTSKFPLTKIINRIAYNY